MFSDLFAEHTLPLSDVGSRALRDASQTPRSTAKPTELGPSTSTSLQQERLQQLELLATDLRGLLTNEQLADVEFELDDGAVVCANRAVLASRSQLFRVMLFGDMRESTERKVKLSGIKEATLKGVLEWCYTGGLDGVLPRVDPDTTEQEDIQDHTNLHALFTARDPVRVNEVDAMIARTPSRPLREMMWAELKKMHPGHCFQCDGSPGEANDSTAEQRCRTLAEILSAADMYGMESLQKLCERKLSKQIDVNSVCAVLAVAAQHGSDSLKTAALQYIAEHRWEVHQTGKLNDLNKELLIEAFVFIPQPHGSFQSFHENDPYTLDFPIVEYL